MATTQISKDSINIVSIGKHLEQPWDEEFQEFVQTLPNEKAWFENEYHHLYQGFWYPSPVIKPVISFQNHFQAHDSDIILISSPKCGTTWLKALTFSIVNRNKCSSSSKEENDPSLALAGPHDLIRFFEYDLYYKNPTPNLEINSSTQKPRLFSSHIPYSSMPTSIKNSNSKIVYICRNPMDTFISLFFFINKLRKEDNESSNDVPLEEGFDLFCRGIHPHGPFFDHVLGHWKASQELPDKVFFLQYENLKEDGVSHVKKMAAFLGFPFSEDEENNGVIEKIVKACSFGELKELEVNKNGKSVCGIPHETFFRKGKVGDWTNYLTPVMTERMKKLIHENLDNTGLTFKL